MSVNICDASSKSTRIVSLGSATGIENQNLSNGNREALFVSLGMHW